MTHVRTYARTHYIQHMRMPIPEIKLKLIAIVNAEYVQNITIYKRS